MSMQLMNRKSLCATFYVYCDEQLEFIHLDAILAPAALYPHSFESFSVVLSLVLLLLLISFSL